MITRKSLKIWVLGFLIWIVAMILIVNYFGFTQTLAELKNLNLAWLLLAILCFMFAVFLEMLNWRMFIILTKIKVKFRDIAQITLAGLFVDDVLPNIAPGGEITMAYLLHRKTGASFSRALVSVVTHMISWFSSFIIFILAILLILLFTGALSTRLMIVLILAVLVMLYILGLMLFIAVDTKKAKRLSLFVVKVIPMPKRKKAKIRAWVVKTVDSFGRIFRVHMHKKRTLLFGAIIMLLHQTFIALSFFFVIQAFNINISLLNAFAIYLFVSLISLLSMIPGQLGIYEILSISTLSITASVISSTLVTAVVRLIHYWSIIFIGGFFAIKQGLETFSMKQIELEAEQVKPKKVKRKVKARPKRRKK